MGRTVGRQEPAQWVAAVAVAVVAVAAARMAWATLRGARPQRKAVAVAVAVLVMTKPRATGVVETTAAVAEGVGQRPRRRRRWRWAGVPAGWPRRPARVRGTAGPGVRAGGCHPETPFLQRVAVAGTMEGGEVGAVGHLMGMEALQKAADAEGAAGAAAPTEQGQRAADRVGAAEAGTVAVEAWVRPLPRKGRSAGQRAGLVAVAASPAGSWCWQRPTNRVVRPVVPLPGGS